MNQNKEARPVEDLCETFLHGATHSDARSAIYVAGQPYHLTVDQLLKRYLESSLDDFISYEARHSVGSFVLVHLRADGMRIVTSPGYCGGYYSNHNGKLTVSTTLDVILREQPTDFMFDDFGLSTMIARLPLSNFKLLPFSSPFENVSRLQPSAVLECSTSGNLDYSSYLLPPKPLAPPASLEAALDEVFTCTVKQLNESGRKGGVLFSGGADCLIFALYLREMMRPEDIDVITMHHTQHSITNGPMRAFPIMQHLGMKLTYGAADYLHSETAIDAAAKSMKRDHAHARGPHIGCVELGISDTDVMTGQNMDSIMNVGMLITHKTLERGYFSPNLSGSKELQELRAFVGNLAYTREFSGSKQLQGRFRHLLRDSVKKGVVDPELGPKGIVRGMFSMRVPNVIMPEMDHVDRMELLNREIEKFSGFAGTNAFDHKYCLDLASHMSWNQLAHKRLSTMPLAGDTRITLPSNSGPMLSYYIGRKRDLNTAAAPKNELYALIRKKAGAKYSELFKNAEEEKWKRTSDPNNSFVRRYQHLLDTNKSEILDRIRSPSIKDEVAGVYKNAQDHVSNGRLLNGACPREMSLIFLELLLANVRGTPVLPYSAEKS